VRFFGHVARIGTERAAWLGASAPERSGPLEDRPHRADTEIMVFDLGKAMSKKEEWESARLLDFEFRRRARATRMTAEALGLDDTQAAQVVATTAEADIPARLALLAGADAQEVATAYHGNFATAHTALVAERGDPTPHRLG
jgi:hypothetical protein